MKEQTHDTKEKTCYEIAAQAAYDKKGWDIIILDMMTASIMADYFVICSVRPRVLPTTWKKNWKKTDTRSVMSKATVPAAGSSSMPAMW